MKLFVFKVISRKGAHLSGDQIDNGRLLNLRGKKKALKVLALILTIRTNLLQ
jgi:hypothetical protein